MNEMNEIEQKFYDAFQKLKDDKDFAFELEIQPVIGVYKVDFLYNRIVIEIDGHNSHKTKEQRKYDYERERYLQKQGYKIIRFMGTEVFLEPEKCVLEMDEITWVYEMQEINYGCQITYKIKEKLRKFIDEKL